MKGKRPPAGDVPLPVDIERLRRQFPALTEDDLDAYVAVTRRILEVTDPAGRARVTREVLARGRAARARQKSIGSSSRPVEIGSSSRHGETGARHVETGGAAPRDDDDRLALRYLTAVEKMQGR